MTDGGREFLEILHQRDGAMTVSIIPLHLQGQHFDREVLAVVRFAGEVYINEVIAAAGGEQTSIDKFRRALFRLEDAGQLTSKLVPHGHLKRRYFKVVDTSGALNVHSDLRDGS